MRDTGLVIILRFDHPAAAGPSAIYTFANHAMQVWWLQPMAYVNKKSPTQSMGLCHYNYDKSEGKTSPETKIVFSVSHVEE